MAPPAFVKHLGSAASKASSATRTTGTLAGTVPIGNTVIVVPVGLTGTNEIISVTDTQGNTYTDITSVITAEGIDLALSRIAVFGSVVTTALGTSDTITATWSAAIGTALVEAFEVSSLTLTLDVTPVHTDATTAPSSTTPSVGPSATTTEADTFAIGVFVASNAENTFGFTAGTNYTEVAEVTTGATGTNRSLAVEYRVLSSTGAQTATGTFTSTPTTTHSHDALLVILRGAGVGDESKVGSETHTESEDPSSATVTTGALETHTEGEGTSALAAATEATADTLSQGEAAGATVVFVTAGDTLSQQTDATTSIVVPLSTVETHTQAEGTSATTIVTAATDTLAQVDANTGISQGVVDTHTQGEGTSTLSNVVATTDTLVLADVSSGVIFSPAVDTLTQGEGASAVAASVASVGDALVEADTNSGIIQPSTDALTLAEGPASPVVVTGTVDSLTLGDVNSGIARVAIETHTEAEGASTLAATGDAVDALTLVEVAALSQSSTDSWALAEDPGQIFSFVPVVASDTLAEGEGTSVTSASVDAVETHTQTENVSSPISYYNQIRPLAPMVYWRLDELSGNATDSSGNGITGLVTAGAYNQAPGVLDGRSMTLGTSTQRVEPADTSLFQFLNLAPYTLEVWFRPTVYDTGYRRIIDKNPTISALREGYLLYLQNTAGFGTERWEGNAASGTSSGPTSVTLNAWHHVVVTYTGVTLRIYVNGVLKGSTGSSRLIQPTTPVPLRVGNSSSLGTNAVGDYDEVAIYDYALSADQIWSNYLAGISGPGRIAAAAASAPEGHTQTDANAGLAQSATDTQVQADANAGRILGAADSQVQGDANTGLSQASTDTTTQGDANTGLAQARTDTLAQADANAGRILGTADSLVVGEAGAGLSQARTDVLAQGEGPSLETAFAGVAETHVQSDVNAGIRPVGPTDALSLGEGASNLRFVGTDALGQGEAVPGVSHVRTDTSVQGDALQVQMQARSLAVDGATQSDVTTNQNVREEDYFYLSGETSGSTAGVARQDSAVLGESSQGPFVGVGDAATLSEASRVNLKAFDNLWLWPGPLAGERSALSLQSGDPAVLGEQVAMFLARNESVQFGEGASLAVRILVAETFVESAGYTIGPVAGDSQGLSEAAKMSVQAVEVTSVTGEVATLSIIGIDGLTASDVVSVLDAVAASSESLVLGDTGLIFRALSSVDTFDSLDVSVVGPLAGDFAALAEVVTSLEGMGFSVTVSLESSPAGLVGVRIGPAVVSVAVREAPPASVAVRDAFTATVVQG